MIETGSHSEQSSYLYQMAKSVVKSMNKARVLCCFLFGSVACGDASPSSDIDLTVVLDIDDQFRRVKRIKCAQTFIDIEYISKRLLEKYISPDPPDMEVAWQHRVIGARALFDPNGYFTNIKRSLLKTFYSRQKVLARLYRFAKCEESFMNKARTQMEKGFQMAAIFLARIACSYSACMVLDIAGQRLSSSKFILKLKGACHFSEVPFMYQQFTRLCRLDLPTDDSENASLAFFKLWNYSVKLIASCKGDLQKITPEEKSWIRFYFSHISLEEIKRKLAYYLRNQDTCSLLYYIDSMIFLHYASLRPLLAFNENKRETTPLMGEFIELLPTKVKNNWTLATRLKYVNSRHIEMLQELSANLKNHAYSHF